jgi:hypothetical protein
MVQVLPGVPGFGEHLIQALSGAAGNIGQGLINRRTNLHDQNVLSQLTANAESSPLQQIEAYSKLSPGAQSRISPLFTHLLDLSKNQSFKREEAQQKATQEHEDVSETINSLADELMEGKTGKFNFYNKLTAKGRESRAYFDELALAIEKRLATMVGKGALNKERFNYLKKNLPSSGDTDASNRGKLRALAKEFKVAINHPSFKEKLKESENEVEGNAQKPSLEELFK